KVVGTGTTSVGSGGLDFRNSGTLDLQTGTLEVTGGGSLRLDEPGTGGGILRGNGGTFTNAVSSQGGFMHDLSANARVLDNLGPLHVNELRLSGGTVTGPGRLTVESSMQWTGGSLEGTGAMYFLAGASLNIPSGSPTYGGRPIDLAEPGAAINWTGGTLSGSSELTLNGQLNVQGNSDKTLSGIGLIQSGPTTWSRHGALRL